MLSCEVTTSGQKWKHRHGRIDFSLFDGELVGEPMKTGGVAKHRQDIKKTVSYLAVSFSDLAWRNLYSLYGFSHFDFLCFFLQKYKKYRDHLLTSYVQV